MKWQYLGTAAAEGFPALFCQCEACRRARQRGGKNLRLRAGLVVNGTEMIDYPPDVMTFSQRFGVDFSGVRDLFVTHSHHDHFDAEDLTMRRFPVFCRLPDPQPLHVYANRAALDRLRQYEQADQTEEYLRLTELEYFKPYTARSGTVYTFLPANHAPWEQAGIYLVQNEGKTALYAHDTCVLPTQTLDFLKTQSLDLASLDCTFGKNAPGYSHMGLPDNRELVATLREAGALKATAPVIVTHFTHNCGQLHEELEAEVKDDGFIVAYDGMTVEF